MRYAGLYFFHEFEKSKPLFAVKWVFYLRTFQKIIVLKNFQLFFSYLFYLIKVLQYMNNKGNSSEGATPPQQFQIITSKSRGKPATNYIREKFYKTTAANRITLKIIF